ncbi:MAG: hypothetical protein L6265_10800 [Thermoplasmatales archaeon]|nr:hypothetical protein [Thermoplasmatales archaeon]
MIGNETSKPFDENIRIGDKPFPNYLRASLERLKTHDKIFILGRGHNISKAVYLAVALNREHSFKIGKICLGSDKYNFNDDVGTIKIIIENPDNTRWGEQVEK